MSEPGDLDMTIVSDHGDTMTERRQIPAGEFKAKCLKLMDEVRETGEELVITKHGKPVAKLVPIAEEVRMPLFGCLKGSVKILGDIVSPALEEDWEEKWLKKWDERLAEDREAARTRGLAENPDSKEY